jgi:hypothetical protein
VCLSTTFPSLVIYEGGCYLLHDDKDKPSTKLTGNKRQRLNDVVDGSSEEEEEGPKEGDAGY